MLDLALGLSSPALLRRFAWYHDPVYAAVPEGGGTPIGAGLIADFRRGRYARTSAPLPSIATAPAEDLGELEPTDIAGLLEFTRASAATFVDAAGALQLANTDQPRFDWSGGRSSLLLERPATNLIPYSQTLSSASWIKASATLPGQTAGAGSVVLESVRRTGDIFGGVQQTVGLVDGTRYAASAFLKKGDGGVSRFGLYNSTDVVWQSTVQINWPASDNPLTAGDISVPANGQRSNPSDIRVQPLSGGIYRLSFVFTAASATGDVVTLNIQANRNADLTANYFGGMQLEISPYATSYIPTTGGTATRAADRCRLGPVAEALLQRSEAGILIQARDVAGADGRLLGSASARLIGFDSTATSLLAGDGAPMTIATGLTSPLPPSGCAVTFGAAGISGCYNGGDIASLAAAMDADRSATYLGRDGTGNFADGRYESLVVWPFRMSAAAVQGKALPYAG